VIEWLPTANVLLLNVARPPLNVRVARVVVPSLKATDPPGVPPPGATALTVAVNVTDWPKADGFTDDVTAVVVLAWFTVCVTAADVLPLKFVSPP
jgi:hypothetical protein